MQQTQGHRPLVGQGRGGPMNYAARGAGRGGQVGGQPRLNYVAAEQLGEATNVVISKLLIPPSVGIVILHRCHTLSYFPRIRE